MYLVLAAVILLATIWAGPKAYMALNKTKLAKSQANYGQNYYLQSSDFIDHAAHHGGKFSGANSIYK